MQHPAIDWNNLMIRDNIVSMIDYWLMPLPFIVVSESEHWIPSPKDAIIVASQPPMFKISDTAHHNRNRPPITCPVWPMPRTEYEQSLLLGLCVPLAHHGTFICIACLHRFATERRSHFIAPTKRNRLQNEIDRQSPNILHTCLSVCLSVPNQHSHESECNTRLRPTNSRSI